MLLLVPEIQKYDFYDLHDAFFFFSFSRRIGFVQKGFAYLWLVMLKERPRMIRQSLIHELDVVSSRIFIADHQKQICQFP